MTRLLAVALVTLALCTARAHAYPQFVLSRGGTCTDCHVSPAGGGLLNENGQIVAQALGQVDTAPELFYGALGLPSYLAASGDFRGAGGYFHSPQGASALFPMQGDLYGEATYNKGHDTSLLFHVTAGFRPAQWNNEAATHAWSREHYVTWQQNLGGEYNFYLRVGRMMPVFGLRLAEHPTYIRRYGGTQLYSETYGVTASYVSPTWEVHGSGFIADPIIDTVEDFHGGAVYAERRLSSHAAIGGEAMVKQDALERYDRIGATSRYFVAEPAIILQAELQYVHHHVNDVGNSTQLVGYALGSWFATDHVMVDLGAGYFNENTHIKNLYRDCFDLNVHWFVESHTELVLNTRLETLAFGSDGPTGAYVLLQAHYRL